LSSIDQHIISIPLYTTKCQRFAFPVKQTERFEKLQQYIEQYIDSGCKLGKASLFYKRGKWYFAVTIKIAAKKTTNSNLMGVDIGLRQLAVVSVKNPQGKEINRQFNNGKQAGFIRKKYRSLRRKLGQSKKVKAIKKINDKEQRWMTDLNPKYTSQSCSKCAKVKKSNRKANLYSCECGNHIHSDLNASRNIANKYLDQQSA